MIRQDDIEKYRQRLTREGWACDIDNTVSATSEAFFGRIDERFPRPEGDENLSIRDMIRKYTHPSGVPTWQSPEAVRTRKEVIADPKFYRELPAIEGAAETVRRFLDALPFAAYITARPDAVAEATSAWLDGVFPTLPVITKPGEVDPSQNNEWKARLLERLYPAIRGIIDDDPRLVKHLSPEYEGRVIIFGASEVEHDHVEAYACPTWDDVEEKLEELTASST